MVLGPLSLSTLCSHSHRLALKSLRFLHKIKKLSHLPPKSSAFSSSHGFWGIQWLYVQSKNGYTPYKRNICFFFCFFEETRGIYVSVPNWELSHMLVQIWNMVLIFFQVLTKHYFFIIFPSTLPDYYKDALVFSIIIIIAGKHCLIIHITWIADA